MSTFKKACRSHQNALRPLTLACMAALLGASVSLPAQAALVSQGAIQSLMVTETVANAAAQTVASTGPLSDSGGYQGQNLTGANANASNLGVVPPNTTLSSTIYQSNTDAVNAVVGYLNPYLQQIASTVSGAMKSAGSASGVQMGLFTFIQNVQIANPAGGNPSQAQVYASLIVQPNGNYQFLGGNINNDTLYLLYAIYQQSKTAYYLPQNWTVPYAGETQWELYQVTVQGNSIQGAPIPVGGTLWHIINDNGAYDAQTSTTSSGKQVTSYASAVQNLVNNQISPLMKQYNATMGILMYGQQVKVARNASGQPLTAISVNNRVLTAGCGGSGTLSNNGQYGYLLSETDNEYIVQQNGAYALAGQVQQNQISPTNNFSESANVGINPQYSNYVNDVVFPIAPDQGQVVNWESGNPLPSSDYVNVAPLTNNATGGGSSTINTAVGTLNVCVGAQVYNMSSPTWSGPYGSTKGGNIDWNTMQTVAEVSTLSVNGSVDSAYFAGAYNPAPALQWNPSIPDPFMPGGTAPLIDPVIYNYILDLDNGQWGGGTYYYGWSWYGGNPPQNIGSAYIFMGAPGGTYTCVAAGCAYSPSFYMYF